MFIGTVCGRLLLYGGLAVALAMDAFPRLTLLALGTVPLLVIVLASHRALFVVVPTVPLCFHTAALALSRESCPSVSVLPRGSIPSIATDLASSVLAVCRRKASLASITA